MKELVLFILCLLFCFSCNNDEEKQSIVSTAEASLLDKQQILEEFGRGLSVVLEESSGVRLLVKNEALKKINYDYDVLYLMVKDLKLNDGNTLEGLLLKYVDKDILDWIEAQYPTLTFFVPSLPDESFSAETWNIDVDKPYVALDNNKEGDVLFIKNAERFQMEYDEIPLFPVIVIKKNERIVANKTKSNSGNSINGTNLYFVDNAFDNTNNKLKAGTRPGSGSAGYKPNSKTIDAYDKMKSNNGWQRDYLYYNIVGSQDRGVFEKRCIETLVGFRVLPDMNGRGMPMFNKIADQPNIGDPQYEYYKDKLGRNGYRWTNGDFEFIIRIILGSKSPTGNETTRGFFASPGSLFSFEYEKDKNGRQDRTKIKDIRCNTYFINPNRELFSWDLNTYSSQYKLSIEEVDSEEETTSTYNTTYEYASNFSYNESTGETTKIGSKFGSSAKVSAQTAFTTKIKKSSDLLGDVIIDFGEPLIDKLDSNNNHEMFKYNSGYFELYLDVKVR